MAATERAAGHLLEQARACAALGSPLYERALRACAADLRAGGPVRHVLADHLDAPGPAATGLRLLGGLHLLALTGRAPALAAHYPSTGGRPGAGFETDLLATVAGHTGELREFVTSPPQTNEVGRAAALAGGLLHVLRGLGVPGAPVRLHEVGASAGLNLLADRYRYEAVGGADGTAGSRWWGPAGSPVQLADAWRGHLPPPDPLHVVERRGSDPTPVDLADPAARDRLLAYVWPDQPARLVRTRAALAVAALEPPVVADLDVVAAVARLAPVDGAVTVLWHSVMWQYVPRPDQERALAGLRSAGRAASADGPLVHLRLEPTRPAPGEPHDFLVTATTWPGGRTSVLARAEPHGVPVTWVAP